MIPICPTWITSVGLFLGGVQNTYISYRLSQKQVLAYVGDKAAARHLVLPCYSPLCRFVSVAYITLAFTALLVTSITDSVSIDLHIIEFCSLCSIILFSIPPVLLLQPSLSLTGFWRTAYILIPWWLFLTLIWILLISAGQSYACVLTIILRVAASVPPLVTSSCMLAGLIPSRMQLGSRANRAGVEFLLCYSVIYGTLVFMSTVMRMPSVSRVGLSVSVFFASQLFPIALYRTLLADTKFWRGMGRHNMGGIVSSKDPCSSVIALPELTMRVASSDFQRMLSDVGDLFIDFAFINIGHLAGTGSSANVYRGSLRQMNVAVKVSTPPEVTADELLKIRQEAQLNSRLRHPCIVRFHGVCIRPPQIGIVIEYCVHGNLRESLGKDIADWTSLRRLEAAHDACRAVAYLHSQGFMHRDIKPENFFVTHDWKVKLGDFGESTTIKGEGQVADSGDRMTVVGTVAYMAPELVEGKAYYSEAIDIYALAVTLWQIWTGNDPFEGVPTFSLYDIILRGERPPLPAGAPSGLAEIILAGWDPSSHRRLSAQGMADRLSVLVDDYRADHTRNKTATNSSITTALQELESSSAIGEESVLSLDPYDLESGNKSADLLRPPSALLPQQQKVLSTSLDATVDNDSFGNGTETACPSSDMSLPRVFSIDDDEPCRGYPAEVLLTSNPLVSQLTGIVTKVTPQQPEFKSTVVWPSVLRKEEV